MISDLRRQLADMAERQLREWFGQDTTRETAAYAMERAPRFGGLDAETRELVLDRFQPEHQPEAYLDYLPCLDTECVPAPKAGAR